MTQQNALVLGEKLGKLVVSTLPIPTPGAGELLIKVHATGLNPIDMKIQSLGMFVEKFPAILGSDAAGEVEQVGDGVERWSKGDRVIFQGSYSDSRFGTFQQYVLVEADVTTKIPNSLTYYQAATIPVTFFTSVIGLYAPKPLGAGLEHSFDGKPRYTGQPAVILGGSTSVGQYVIQLLKLSGFSPIVAYAASKHTDDLKALGATHIIDRNITPLSDLTSSVQNITTDPIKLVFDTVTSLEAQQAGYDVLSSGGTLSTLHPIKVKNITEDKAAVFIMGSVTMSPPHRAFGKEVLFKYLQTLLEDGTIQPLVPEVLPGGLESIVGGLERLKNGQVSRVKLVVNPQEK